MKDCSLRLLGGGGGQQEEFVPLQVIFDALYIIAICKPFFNIAKRAKIFSQDLFLFDSNIAIKQIKSIYLSSYKFWLTFRSHLEKALIPPFDFDLRLFVEAKWMHT